jgi:hypothetical protein
MYVVERSNSHRGFRKSCFAFSSSDNAWGFVRASVRDVEGLGNTIRLGRWWWIARLTGSQTWRYKGQSMAQAMFKIRRARPDEILEVFVLPHEEAQNPLGVRLAKEFGGFPIRPAAAGPSPRTWERQR